MTAHEIGLVALAFAFGILFAQLVHTIRRHRKFAAVRARYLKARVDGTDKGLYLELPDNLDYDRLARAVANARPTYGDIHITGNPFTAGAEAGGKNAPHVCSFTPCPHLQREADRRAVADRLKGGAA